MQHRVQTRIQVLTLDLISVKLLSLMSLGVPIYEMAKCCESPGDSAVHIPGVPGMNSTHPAFSLAGTASENGDIRMHEEFSFGSSISKNNCCSISLASSEPVEGRRPLTSLAVNDLGLNLSLSRTCCLFV